MISGVLYALLAGLMWGLIFVGPLIVPEYPAMLQSMGRYLALGLIALPIAWLGRVRLRQLARRDWLTALMLTMMGNLIYYFCLASAIQRTGAPVSTMIIGTLPVVIPVFANLLYSQRDGKLAWGKLAPALICIGIGLASVNIAELNHGLPDFDWARYTSSIVLALVSVVCWAWYALRNARWLRENYPDCLFVGTSTSEGPSNSDPAYESAGNSNSFLKNVPLEVLLKGMQEKLDVYSYHYYNGVAERLRAMMPNSYWLPDRATSEDYLDVARSMIQYHTEKRDIYCPGGEIWVTESGDAGGGGTTWASTYLDVFRTLNELGAFCTVTKGIIFHNTLASSDYGFLSHGSFDPRPNYFAVLLWHRLMGSTAYDTAEPIREGAHVYAHSRADGKPGKAYLIINNSRTDATTVALPKDAEVYQLSAETLRAETMLCNGRALVLGEGNALPEMAPVAAKAGELTLPAATCTFIVL